MEARIERLLLPDATKAYLVRKTVLPAVPAHVQALTEVSRSLTDQSRFTPFHELLLLH